MATPSINTVPADLVLEIMARLPVKSVMRLRLISKSFFSTTAAPNFISSHLALSKSSGYVALPSRYPQSFIAILDNSFSEVLRTEIPSSFFPRSESNPLKCIYFLVGSCNGLLCVTNSRVAYYGRVVVLWNPMIGKFKSISDTSLDSNILGDRRTKVTVGFGYDEKNDDYKIIRIVISPDKNESSAEIYSLKTNSWKRVIFPINYSNNIFLIESCRCAFVHGALHWIVYLRGPTNPVNNPIIFSFKIDDEQFKVIRLPHNHEREPPFSRYVHLMALKESLALCIYDEDRVDAVSEGCRVWKMKKYEEVESWTKQILPVNDVFEIYGFTEDGELMFSENYLNVSLYNLDTGARKESVMVNAKYVYLFRESLVLL